MAQSKTSGCCCSSALQLVFSCSGAADVGELADRAARKLTADGVAKMFCLAGIGGRVSGIVKSTEAASKVVAVDGCPLDCARKTLEEAGFSHFDHVRLSDLGLVKGESPVTEAQVATVVRAVAPYFAGRS